MLPFHYKYIVTPLSMSSFQSTICMNAKVFLGGLCHDRVAERHLDPIIEGGRFGREFIRSEWKSLTSHSIFSIPTWDSGSPLVLGSMYPPHTRSRSTKGLIRARQGSVGRAQLPSHASSSLSSSLDVNKCLPPLQDPIAFCLYSPDLGVCVYRVS